MVCPREGVLGLGSKPKLGLVCSPKINEGLMSNLRVGFGGRALIGITVRNTKYCSSGFILVLFAPSSQSVLVSMCHQKHCILVSMCHQQAS